jgi:hypothetical protein
MLSVKELLRAAPARAPAGQQHPTRVIRLIAANSVEQQVLALQAHKMSTSRHQQRQPVPAVGGGGGGGGAPASDDDDDEDGGEVIVQAQELDSGSLLRFFRNV